MKTKIIIIIIALLTINVVMATPVIDWLIPSQNNEIIDTYPQTIKYVARDTGNIDSCQTNISDQTYNTSIGTTNADVTINTKLIEGAYNVTINCTDGANTTQETLTIVIDDMMNLSRQREENKKIYIYIFIIISLALLFITQKKNSHKLLIGIIATIASIIIYTQINENLLIIPITLTGLITITYLIKTIFKA